MEWYRIALIVVSYLIIWIISALVIRRLLYEDIENSVLAGLFWPIILPIVMIYLIVDKIDDWLNVDFRMKHKVKKG